MLIRIAHESPNSIFKEVSGLTDIDYALVHLFEENEQYLKNFKESAARGREIILDNSIFELGEAFDPERYADWIVELKPTWYIIPDVLEDGFATIQEFVRFKQNFEGLLPGRTIAASQGKTLYELLFCFEFLHNDPFTDMVALTFNLSLYENLIPVGDSLTRKMLGRQLVIELLNERYKAGYFHKSVHLLGCALPQEGLKYRDIPWIYSVDTSNPIMCGIEHNEYEDWGISTKSKTKLFTIIDEQVSLDQLNSIKYNIEMFKGFWRN